MQAELYTIFDRDLGRLKQEIESFNSEENLWITTGSIKNSAGNLCLHVAGNLKTYIGKNLGNTPYVRDRDAEFSTKGIARTELIRLVEETRTIVLDALRNDIDLNKTYPEQTLGHEMTTGFFLVHIVGHLSYHLGQVNYLRRALEG